MDWSHVLNTLSMTLLFAGAVCLFVALILQMATRWITHLDVPYLASYGAVFFSAAVVTAVDVPLGYVLDGAGLGQETELITRLSLTPLYFVMSSFILKRRLELSFGQAALVLLLVMLIASLLAAAGFAAVWYYQQRASRA